MVTAAHPRATPAGLTVQLMTPTPRQTAHERTQAVPTIRKSWITAVTSSARRYSVSTLAAILIGVVVTAVPQVYATNVGTVHHFDGDVTRPHVLTTELADLLVHVGGGATCTGTPITGTTFIVTAAHCILDNNGQVGSRTVQRDGVEYIPVSVLVNPAYHHSPGPLLDAAVLVMDQSIPGPSATLGDALPSVGLVTLAGFQPLDTDGSLLRGTRYDNRPLPKSATGGVVTIDSTATGCSQPVADLEITDTQVKMSCGLIPGASGGGLFVERNNDMVLIGIISTVAQDLTYNGVVPLPALHALLDDSATYTHQMPLAATTHSEVNTLLS